jgi:hypothetical protein
LWFDGGGLVGHDVGHAIEPSDAVFELLRLTQGTFSFLAGTPSGGGPRVEVEGILGEAQARLVEWREIEAVVPSLDAWLQLSPEPPMAHVSMRGEQWRLVVAVGAGCPVGGVLAHLGMEELPGCRAVKELIEAGLIDLTAAAAPALPPFWHEPEPLTTSALDEPEADLDIVFHTVDHAVDEPEIDDAEPAYTALEDPYVEPDPEDVPAPLAAWATEDAEPLGWMHDGEDGQTPAAAPEPAVVGRPSAPAVAPAASAAPATVPDWRTELGDLPDLDSIANMPTRRRRADAGDEVGAPSAALDELAEPEEGEEPLNRGLLLKFLSSVRN